MFQFLGLAVLVLGVFLFVVSLRTVKAIDRDEFNRRTGGGALEYETYEDSLKARNRKSRNRLFGQFSVLVMIAGGVLAAGGPKIERMVRESRTEQTQADDMRRCADGDADACRKVCRELNIPVACQAASR